MGSVQVFASFYTTTPHSAEPELKNPNMLEETQNEKNLQMSSRAYLYTVDHISTWFLCCNKPNVAQNKFKISIKALIQYKRNIIIIILPLETDFRLGHFPGHIMAKEIPNSLLTHFFSARINYFYRTSQLKHGTFQKMISWLVAWES